MIRGRRRRYRWSAQDAVVQSWDLEGRGGEAIQRLLDHGNAPNENQRAEQQPRQPGRPNLRGAMSSFRRTLAETEVPRITHRLATILPLPRGEGRSEGEGTARPG